MAGTFSRIVWRGDVAEQRIREATARGLNLAAERLQAIVVPFTPYLDGDLTKAYGIHQATPESIGEGAQLQNSSKYAAAQHEGTRPDGWTVRRHTTDPHPLARTKFVEVPFRESRDELFGIIGAEIARSLA